MERSIRNFLMFVQENVKFCCEGVMVYARISVDGHTDLYIIRNRALRSRRYSEEIFRLIVVPYTAIIEDNFMSMDDSCRPYRAKLV